MRISLLVATLALVMLGNEPAEGEDLIEAADHALSEVGVSIDDLVTEEAAFRIGYARGLASREFSNDLIPGTEGKDGHEPDKALGAVLEDGYMIGLAARDLNTPPPAGVMYSGYAAKELHIGNIQAFAAKLDLSTGHRLAASLDVGSGKDKFTIPAGTPIELVSEAGEGADRVAFVRYDVAVLRVPNPVAQPTVVSGDSKVTPVKAPRKTNAAAGSKKSSTGAARQSGPSLKDAILHQAETWPGLLQSNGAFAARVRLECAEAGIGDKASTFMQKADNHVPYYANCIKPTKEGEAGRTGYTNPPIWVVFAATHRARILRADGETAEQKIANTKFPDFDLPNVGTFDEKAIREILLAHDNDNRVTLPLAEGDEAAPEAAAEPKA